MSINEKTIFEVLEGIYKANPGTKPIHEIEFDEELGFWRALDQKGDSRGYFGVDFKRAIEGMNK